MKFRMSGEKKEEQCKWYFTHTPYGFPVYATDCWKMKLSYASGIDIYCPDKIVSRPGKYNGGIEWLED